MYRSIQHILQPEAKASIMYYICVYLQEAGKFMVNWFLYHFPINCVTNAVSVKLWATPLIQTKRFIFLQGGTFEFYPKVRWNRHFFIRNTWVCVCLFVSEKIRLFFLSPIFTFWWGVICLRFTFLKVKLCVSKSKMKNILLCEEELLVETILGNWLLTYG